MQRKRRFPEEPQQIGREEQRLRQNIRHLVAELCGSLDEDAVERLLQLAQIHQLLKPDFDPDELETMSHAQLKKELCRRLGNALEPPSPIAPLFDYYSTINSLLRAAHQAALKRRL